MSIAICTKKIYKIPSAIVTVPFYISRAGRTCLPILLETVIPCLCLQLPALTVPRIYIFFILNYTRISGRGNTGRFITFLFRYIQSPILDSFAVGAPSTSRLRRNEYEQKRKTPCSDDLALYISDWLEK